MKIKSSFSEELAVAIQLFSPHMYIVHISIVPCTTVSWIHDEN